MVGLKGLSSYMTVSLTVICKHSSVDIAAAENWHETGTICATKHVQHE
jgi:hypothetical protein